MRRCLSIFVLTAAVGGLLAGPDLAVGQDRNQLEQNLSAYTGPNAQGYLGPFRDALGSALNSGLFMYGDVPESGLHLRFDVRAMLVYFGDGDKTFQAVTEDYYGDPETVEAPTIVGSSHSVRLINNDTGAIYTFPGGFDVQRFGLAVPQLTIGAVAGTEVFGRFMALDFNDSEIEKIETMGFGARHCLTQTVLKNLPFDLSVGGMYNKIKVNDTLLDVKALTFGAQAGRRWGPLAGYAGLSYDSVEMSAEYESDVTGAAETVSVDLDKESTAHLTLGGTWRMGFVHLNAELNVANQKSLAFGLGFGN